MNSNISTKLSEEERDVEKDFGGKNTILLPNAKCFLQRYSPLSPPPFLSHWQCLLFGAGKTVRIQPSSSEIWFPSSKRFWLPATVTAPIRTRLGVYTILWHIRSSQQSREVGRKKCHHNPFMDMKRRFSKVKGLVPDHTAAQVTELDRERMHRGGTGLQTRVQLRQPCNEWGGEEFGAGTGKRGNGSGALTVG